jgi:hypothetical protein
MWTVAAGAAALVLTSVLARAVPAAGVAASLGLLAAFVLWIRSSRRLVRGYGANPAMVMPVWALCGWLPVAAAGYPHVYGLTETRNDALLLGTRLLAVAVLLEGVLHIRSRIIVLGRIGIERNDREGTGVSPS